MSPWDINVLFPFHPAPLTFCKYVSYPSPSTLFSPISQKYIHSNLSFHSELLLNPSSSCNLLSASIPWRIFLIHSDPSVFIIFSSDAFYPFIILFLNENHNLYKYGPPAPNLDILDLTS